MRHGRVHVRRLFELLILIDALLDEDPLERGVEEFLAQFAAFDLQLCAQQPERLLGGVSQHLADGHESRLVVLDHAAIHVHALLAVGEGVERVDRLVRRYARGQMDQDLHLARRVVVHLADLDFPLLVGLDDGVDQGARRVAIGDFGDGQRAVVHLRDPRPDLHHAAAVAVVVLRHVHQAARLKVGVEREFLAAQTGHGGVDQLVEIVRQDLRRQSHGDALRPLRQQQGELDRQADRLAVAPVVRLLPDGRLGVKHRLEREPREARLDVSRCRRAVAREDVAPVSLAVDQQILLPELHQRVADRGVAVRVKLHRLAHHVGHLIISSVVDPPHGVQDASLHRLQPVVDVWHGPLQDHVRGIIQEPALIHARQMAHAVRTDRPPRHHIASARALGRVRLHRLVRQPFLFAFVFFFHIYGL